MRAARLALDMCDSFINEILILMQEASSWKTACLLTVIQKACQSAQLKNIFADFNKKYFKNRMLMFGMLRCPAIFPLWAIVLGGRRVMYSVIFGTSKMSV